MSAGVWAILALALLVRLPFQRGVDADIFIRWIRAIQAYGLTTIYDGTGVDYPPLSLHLLAAIGWIAAHLPPALGSDDRILIGMLKLPEAVADIVTATLIAAAVREASSYRRVLVFAVYALNPAIWYVAAYWSQLDGLYTACLVLSLTMLARNRFVPAWLAFTIAVGIKLQSIALAPVLLVATARRGGWRALGPGLAASLALAGAICLPWLVSGRMGDVVRGGTTLTPRIDESAYNFWYFLRLGDVHMVSSAVRLWGVSYEAIAIAACGGCFVLIGLLVQRQGRDACALAGALASLGLFLFMPAAHERYMFPALAFVLLAWVDHDCSDRMLWRVYVLLSVTLLFNLVTVAPPVPTWGTNLIALQPPYSGVVVTLKALAVVAAGINTFIFALLMVALSRDAPTAGSTRTASS